MNYPKGKGVRGAYPVLLDKFEPRHGRLLGTRLNAWKRGAECVPEYEPLDGEQAQSRQRAGGEQAQSSPNKEVRSKKLKKEEKSGGLFSNQEQSNSESAIHVTSVNSRWRKYALSLRLIQRTTSAS